MELTAFEKLVRQNRSYRGFDESRKVDREELLRMVDCARLSASSVNLQPLKYYLAWEPEAVGRIQPLTGWARNLPEMTLPHKGMYPTAFIVICQDKSISDSLARFQKDVGIAAQTILLAAVEMGLGGCMIGVRSYGWIDKDLDRIKEYGYYWTSTVGENKSGKETAYYRKVIFGNNGVQRSAIEQGSLLNVRWCRDAKTD